MQQSKKDLDALITHFLDRKARQHPDVFRDSR